jgi:hypothetical protein
VGEVDWSFRAEYMHERHGIEVESANEALGDPDALRIDPDPASRSGRSVRTIGFSTKAGCLVTVITVEEAGVTYGANGCKSNEIDIGRYGEERP